MNNSKPHTSRVARYSLAIVSLGIGALLGLLIGMYVSERVFLPAHTTGDILSARAACSPTSGLSYESAPLFCL